MKLFKKIIYILIIFIMLITIFQINAEAYEWGAEITKQASSSGDDSVMTPVKNISGSVITIARIVCAGVAIIMLTVLAMKYMLSAPGDRATIKKHAVVYVVGAVIMFACTGILGIIQNFAGNI